VGFVVLDTDVASASLRGRLPDRLRARLSGQTVCITFVTLGELTKWTHLRSWGPRRMADLRDWQKHVVVLPYDEAVPIVWGEIQARGQHRGRPRPVNDSWVAACCLVHGLPFATFNVKDYADFATHEGLQLVDAGPGPVRPA
jgi:predicted nucleic acid-binding protein